MAGDDYNLFGMLAAFQIADHVIADSVWQSLRCQNQVHPHCSLRGQVRDQLCVFRCYGSTRNLWRIVRITQRARVWQAIVGAACRSIQRGDRAKTCGSARTATPISDRLTVSLSCETIVGELLIKLCIEQNDFSGDARTTERL